LSILRSEIAWARLRERLWTQTWVLSNEPLKCFASIPQWLSTSNPEGIDLWQEVNQAISTPKNHNLEAQRLSRLVREKTLGRTTVAPDTV
jgi:hypothetical protein